MSTIALSKDFSATPGGRFKKHGPHSGEEFREGWLLPALDAALVSGETVTIDLDGIVGLPSSFLEEAFGGAVRKRPSIGIDKALQTIKLQTSERELEPYITLAHQYMREAAGRPRVN